MYNKITSNAWNEVQHKKNSRSTKKKNKNTLTNKNKQSETQYKLSIQTK